MRAARAGRPLIGAAVVALVARLAGAQPTQTPVPQQAAAPAAVTCLDTPDAAPATLRDTCLTVPAGADGPAFAMPVVVVRGAAPGPTLVVTAGVHGAEYAPIVAAGRVRARFAADARLARRMRGRLVLVLLANPPAFWGRSVYYVPADGRNLNRVFPGRADGTQSERIAWTLAERALRAPGGGWADAYVDLQAGDANEALVPHVYAPVTGDAAYDARSLALARATGLAPAAVVDSTLSFASPGDGVWSAAVAAGARVAAGALLGRLADVYVRPLAEVHTPAPGRVLYVTRTPPVRRGESLAYLAVREGSAAPAPVPP